ncbi:MAG: PEP-CTERM sorting domain-containing protein [Phycisphaeraceae bacterium]
MQLKIAISTVAALALFVGTHAQAAPYADNGNGTYTVHFDEAPYNGGAQGMDEETITISEISVDMTFSPTWYAYQGHIQADESDVSILFDSLVEVSSMLVGPENGSGSPVSGTITGYNGGDVEWTVSPSNLEEWTTFTDGAGSFVDRVRFEHASGSIFDVDDVTIAAVPEPASLALLGLGGLAMLARRRRMA